MRILATLPENALVAMTIGTANHPTITDTSGETVTVRLTDASDASATPVEVGTASGAAAGTNITVNLDLTTSGIAVDKVYVIEAISDLTGPNPKTLIPSATTGFPAYVRIANIQAVT